MLVNILLRNYYSVYAMAAITMGFAFLVACLCCSHLLIKYTVCFVAHGEINIYY